MRRSRLALLGLPVLVISLSGCFPGGEGETLAADVWFDYSGENIGVAKKCANFAAPSRIPDLPEISWDATQYSAIVVEQSEENEHWFTVRGTLTFLSSSPTPVVEWTCYASEWGSAGSITSYEVLP